MMDELNPVRRHPGEASEAARSSWILSRRSTSGIRRLAWELFLLLGLVGVTAYVLERSGMQGSGSAGGTILGEHAGPVRSIEFVCGTSNLVSLDTTGESWLWDTTTRRVRSSMGGPGSWVSSQALDPQGRTLATGGRDGTIALWDLATGKRHAFLLSVHGPIRALAFSRDGQTIALSEADSVILLDATTRRVRSMLQAQNGVVTTLAFSPDGRTLASVSRDQRITLWDLETGQPRETLRGYSAPIYSIAFAPPNGMTLASAHADGIVRLWDVASQRTRGVLRHPHHAVFAVAFAADGKTLATGHGGGIIVLWDADTLQERTTLRECGFEVRALAFSPDGQMLGSGGSDSVVRSWELNAGR